MTACACAIFVRHSRILLGKRAVTKSVCPDCWDVIGGHLEPGENVKQALIREAQEEVGLTPMRFVPAGILHDKAALHFFIVFAWRGGEPKMLGDEHSELGWFTVAEACALQPLASPKYPSFFRRLNLEERG